jgi:four helix bundle protein
VSGARFKKMEISSYKDLIVWQKSVNVCILVYELTENFPREEIYGLTSQMRRAVVSIPSNIAEGKNRSTRKDYSQFLRISLGSCAELQTQIEISRRLPQTKNLNYKTIESDLVEISKMLSVLIGKLSYN